MISYWFSKRKTGDITDPWVLHELYTRIWNRRIVTNEEGRGLTAAGPEKTLISGDKSVLSSGETPLKK
jgi:hypothetical protein